MKSFLPLFVSVFSLLFIGCSDKEANEKQQTYVASYVDRSLIIDGYLDEAAWHEAPWTSDFIDIEGVGKPSPLLDTRTKMLWDKHYLYVAAEMTEPNLWATLTEHDAIIYRDNDFEIFIDPDGDGLNYYEFEINALGTVLDLFMEKPYSKGGKANIPWDFEGIKSAVSLQGSLNDPSDTDTSWIVEVAIPWTSFSSNLKDAPHNGDKWRINFSRVQWELDTMNGAYIKKDLPENNWVWSPQRTINMHLPEMWGYLSFKGKPAEDISEIPRLWIWTGADKKKSSSDWDSTFRALKDIGITGILMSADSTVLQKVIPIAELLDMQVHAWFWTMNRADANPEWWSYNQLGKSLAEEKAYVEYYKFMCPAIPAVKEFIRAKMNGLAQIKGLKGIHMDYIRYVDVILPIGLWDKYGLVQDHIMPEYDYGYHPYMRELFNEEYGFDPMDKADIAGDSNWINFRMNELNKTVIGLRDFANSKGMVITAAVFPTPEMSREMVRQDWGTWGLDYYFPMVYHNFYNQDIGWIKEVMQENRASIPEDSKLFCGLFLPALKNDGELHKAMNAALDGGADGIAFFDLNALTGAQKSAIKKLSIQMKAAD